MKSFEEYLEIVNKEEVTEAVKDFNRGANFKKIDVFYDDPKKGLQYLHSTNSYPTCKAAVEAAQNKKDLKGRIGVLSFDPKRIKAEFSKTK